MTREIRCAIYTRKSSEEGLEQAFNTLQAQREACEAYVLSQAGEGWRVLPTMYGDGGYSGGTMDRPALRRLLADVAAGDVDTVVVYKIDRLTRALTDFAKIVETLDGAGASFVSVTQAFNTTSSMGRLTLNVLLSFAQFEREITGERIRDKIAASKAKGMWMGGNLPLGYDAPTSKTSRGLIVNPAEAETVRLIFHRYLELGSVSALERWLRCEGIHSKAYVSSRGRPIGGRPLGRGALFYLLKNRIYRGEIVHKGQAHPGLHAPILDVALFDAVQASLSAGRQANAARPTRAATAPLRGRLFDEDGHPMSPTFTRGRGGRVHRYYVSSPLQQGQRLTKSDAIRRVSAQALEGLVCERVAQLLKCGAGFDEVGPALRRVQLRGTSIEFFIEADDLVAMRERLVDGESVDPDERGLRVTVPVRAKLRGGRTCITSPSVRSVRLDPALIRALRSARRIAIDAGLIGSGRQVAAPVNPYERKLVTLAFLSPQIQQAILHGEQPAGLNLAMLTGHPPPLAWADQPAWLASLSAA